MQQRQDGYAEKKGSKQPETKEGNPHCSIVPAVYFRTKKSTLYSCPSFLFSYD